MLWWREGDLKAARAAASGDAFRFTNRRVGVDQFAEQALEGGGIIAAAGGLRPVLAAQGTVIEAERNGAAHRPLEAAGSGEGPGMLADGLQKDEGGQPLRQRLQ